MTTYAVLLRGVNVGGHRKVPSAELRAAAGDADLRDARTYANSGNLVVTCGDDRDTRKVEADLVAALSTRLGLELPLVAVDAGRLARLVGAVPFPDAARDSPAQVLAYVGPRAVDDDGVARLAAEHDGPERIVAAEGVVYVHFPDGLGRTRLTGDRLDRAAGTWTTGRNWRTVTRLLTMTTG